MPASRDKCDGNRDVFLRVQIHRKGFSSGDRPRPVIANLGFYVKPGEILTLLGPSGCGKTTILQIVAGLDREFDGVVELCGNTISAPARDRGFVFQEPRLLDWRRVADNVDFALPRTIEQSERRRRVREVLKRVGLWNARDAWPYQLSGGMQKRVALARALVNLPKVLLLDEPFSALDVLTKYALQKLVANLCIQERLTTVLVTHDFDEAVYLSDRIAILSTSPATIQAEIDVPLPRPRCRTSSEFEMIRLDLLGRYLTLFPTNGEIRDN